MSEHHDARKAHESHAIQEDRAKGRHDPKKTNPKMSSDIACRSKEFEVLGRSCTKSSALMGPRREGAGGCPSQQDRLTALLCGLFCLCPPLPLGN
jgi:hypothetical protein